MVSSLSRGLYHADGQMLDEVYNYGSFKQSKEMLAEPFEAFTFSPASASVYQLGTFGTARKELKTLESKP